MLTSRIATLALSALALLPLSTLLTSCNNEAGKAAKTPGPHGIRVADMDTTAKPGEDFYQFATGGWRKANPIPATEGSWGSFDKLGKANRVMVQGILKDAAEDKIEGKEAQMVGDFYKSGMDSAGREKLGMTPIKPLLDRIAAIKTKEELKALFVTRAKEGSFFPFGMYVGQDDRQSTQYMLTAYQSGLGMPEKDYYTRSDDKAKADRAAYVAYNTKLGVLSGQPEAEAKAAAERVLALETKLAEAHKTNVETRDPIANYNKIPLKAFIAAHPNLPVKEMFDGFSIKTDSINNGQPKAYERLNALFASESLETWKDYMRFAQLRSAAEALNHEFEAAAFAYAKQLYGAKEDRPRWEKVTEMLNGQIGDAVGHVYVDRFFPAESKKQMEELIENLRKALSIRIDKLDWMSPETKKQAQVKLKTIVVKVGYPDKWKSYEGLEIKEGDYFGNIRRASLASQRRDFDKLGKPLDRTEWFMSPQTVNAYYNPSMNEIVFPAAILQPPFFDPEADLASNYGAIGGVIGHEITHGFDDQGRQYDEKGNLRDWWTKEDAERYKGRAGKVVAQYAMTEPMPGVKVNGELTQGENIADIGGVQIAYDALQIALAKDKEAAAKKIDGFTPNQRFFIAWAQVWSTNSNLDAMKAQVQTDPHSPGELRGWVPLTNLPDFYKAFDLKEGQKMVRPAKEQAAVW